MTEPGDREILRVLARTLDPATTCARLKINRAQLRQCLERAAQGEEPESVPGAETPGAFTLNIDGAARGNPGPAGAGVVIRAGGKIFEEFGEYLGETTNNQAEYRALVLALRQARQWGVREVEVLSDSELLVKQMIGEYRVKNPELKILYQEAVDLKRGFERFSIRHVPRAENAAADRMANRAIDEFRE